MNLYKVNSFDLLKWVGLGSLQNQVNNALQDVQSDERKLNNLVNEFKVTEAENSALSPKYDINDREKWKNIPRPISSRALPNRNNKVRDIKHARSKSNEMDY